MVVLTLATTASVLLPAKVSEAATLSDASWFASSTTTGATSVTYTYDFSTATASHLSSIQFSVPTGTSGTPTVGRVVAYSTYAMALGTPTVSLSGTTLTLSFSNTFVPSATMFSVPISGLTNSSTAGTSTSKITTYHAATAVDTVTTPPVTLTANALNSPYWSTSSTTPSATGVSYNYSLTTSTSATLSALAITVPGGTAGTPNVASTTPAAIAGGTLSKSGSVLTYSFTATSVPAGTSITISLSGLTNTPLGLDYGGEVVTYASPGTTAVDSGALAAIGFSSSSLTSLSWSASSTTTNAASVAYNYSFTTATAVSINEVRMTVPGGTGGTPAVGSVTVTPSYITLPSPSVSLSGGALIFLFTGTYLPSGAVISIQITGLTNTGAAGSYASAITTYPTTAFQPPVDSGVAPAVIFSGVALTSLSWSVSSTAVGATNATYTYSFNLSATSTLSSISMSVPPATGGSPVVTSASPGTISGGTVTLSGTTLTYSFTAVSVSSSSTITLVIGGMTNTSTAGGYASAVTTYNGATVVASGTTPTVTFTSTVLTSLSWSASSTTVGTAGVSYTYGFTTASGTSLSSVTLTVPGGTGGTATVGTVSVYSPSNNGYITLANQAVSLSLTTLTFSFNSVYIASGCVWSIQINGMTNTSNPGTYTSSITTRNGSAAVDSGTTPSLSFSSSALGNPTWTASSTGVGATNTIYTYTFAIQANATIDAVTMTVPSGTGGTPAVGTVTPAALTGGSVTLTSNTLTYALATATSVSINTNVSIQITGLTNTATAGAYTSTITISYQGTAIASGTTPSVTFTSTVLTRLSWSTSANHTAATGVTYTFGFTTASTTNLNQVTMTVPNGTGGTPGVGTVTPAAFSGGSIVLSGTTLTYTFSSTYVTSGTAVSIAISGLTNPATPGTSTSVVTTKNSGASIDSGTTPSVTFVGGPLGSTAWTTSSTTSGGSASYTYSFTTASTSPLTSITMSVPSGTRGTPTIGTVTPNSITTGASASLNGTTLTYSFTSTSVGAGTSVSIVLNGLTNTTNTGAFTSLVTTYNGAGSIDSGTSGSVTFIVPTPQSLTFTNTCSAGSGTCTVNASGGTMITLLVLPGGSFTASNVVLTVQTNAAGGYRVQSKSSSLTTLGGSTLSQASTSGTSSRPVNAFYSSAVLSASGSSGAALCTPYGSGTPYVGYSTSSPASIWNATSGTGVGLDTVTLTNAVQVSTTQPAGIYTGTISYLVEPVFTGSSSC